MNENNLRRPSSAAPRRQFLDVVHPGRTPALPTSRPVITGSSPAVQDTSMKPSAPAVPKDMMASRQAPKKAMPQPAVQPQQFATLPPPPAPVPPAPAPVQAPQPQPVAAPPRPVVPSRPQQQPQLHASPVRRPMPSAPIPAVVQPQQASDSQPIPEQHREKHSVLSEVLAILAIVLLVAIILNILVDADILSLPIPHTNFFDY